MALSVVVPGTRMVGSVVFPSSQLYEVTNREFEMAAVWSNDVDSTSRSRTSSDFNSVPNGRDGASEGFRTDRRPLFQLIPRLYWPRMMKLAREN
jgi:hypothetical protein